MTTCELCQKDMSRFIGKSPFDVQEWAIEDNLLVFVIEMDFQAWWQVCRVCPEKYEQVVAASLQTYEQKLLTKVQGV